MVTKTPWTEEKNYQLFHNIQMLLFTYHLPKSPSIDFWTELCLFRRFLLFWDRLEFHVLKFAGLLLVPYIPRNIYIKLLKINATTTLPMYLEVTFVCRFFLGPFYTYEISSGNYLSMGISVWWVLSKLKGPFYTAAQMASTKCWRVA